MLLLMALPVLAFQVSAEPPPPPQEADALPLIAGVASSAACLSVIALAALVLRRRRDLFAPRIVLLLLLVLLALSVGHLVPAVALAGVAVPAPDLAVGVAALVAALGALGVWPLLPRLIGLANPAALRREIEERRLAEAQARASEARARDAERRMAAFLAHVPEALLVLRVGAGGALAAETANPAFERLFGPAGASLPGAPPEALLPSAVAARLRACWRAQAAGGETMECEMMAELPDGQRYLQMTLVPMRGPDGQVERLLGSVRDVTATRRLQQGLVQSARLATVGTICAGLAHEASQPLNIAALWLRRVRTAAQVAPAGDRASLMRTVQVVDDQLRRAGDLVARMRGLAGEDPREAAWFDATQPVAAALRIVAAQMAGQGIALSLRGAGQRLGVHGNAARLEQAVLALLSNARDAVLDRRGSDPRAPARIEVALRRSPGLVAIEVRDSGAGVPEALADRIFDPFFTTKEPGRGTGVGLALAAGVARSLGGGIETWNLPGGGACFRMEFAAVEPGAGASARGAAKAGRGAIRAGAHAA